MKFEGPKLRGPMIQALKDHASMLPRGDWMQTESGQQFWPLHPKPEEVDIFDVAGALSKLCRFGGHCLRFYSVAEHCVLVASKASVNNRMAALLHDASEAYLSDIVRPVKSSLPDYKRIEAALEGCIANRFDLPYPWPEEVKQLDERILLDEKAQNMSPAPTLWKQELDRIEPLDVKLRFWDPETARSNFLFAFDSINLGYSTIIRGE